MSQFLKICLMLVVLSGCSPKLKLERVEIEELPVTKNVKIMKLDTAMREKLGIKKGDLLVAFGAEGTTTLYSSDDETFGPGKKLPLFKKIHGIEEKRRIRIQQIKINPDCWVITERGYEPRYFPYPHCPPF